jgi:archaeal flagellar protein FlaJ
MGITEMFSGVLDKKGAKPRRFLAKKAATVAGEPDEITRKIEREHKSRTGIRRFFKHPYDVLTEQPVNILIVSVPLALFAFFWGLFSAMQSQGLQGLSGSAVIDDYVVLAVLITIIPVAVLDFFEDRRMHNLEASLPNFFRDIAGMNDSGMTLPNAVHLVAGSEYGSLTPHVRQLDNEMSWGVGFVEGMYSFGKKLGAPLADRSVDLIAKASKAGGDISQVLHAAAKDTFEIVNLADERRNNMIIYVIIVLVSSAVFLFVIAILVSTFFTTMATAGAAAQAAGAGSQFMGRIDLAGYKRLFSHAALIQAFFSGLAAGQMGEGRVIAGLKYSAVMLCITWVVFQIFIL